MVKWNKTKVIATIGPASNKIGVLKNLIAAGVPVITATQMLESMVSNKRPTRAEATDIANAVWEGTDAIMLSEETSIGAYPVAAVKEMVAIAKQAETRLPIFEAASPYKNRSEYQAVAISQAAKLLSDVLQAQAIVTPTQSGRTALMVSKQRPRAQILAPTEHIRTARKMCLYWGVMPMMMEHSPNVDKLLEQAEEVAKKSGLIKSGDTIITTSGSHWSKDDITRIVEVRRVR